MLYQTNVDMLGCPFNAIYGIRNLASNVTDIRSSLVRDPLKFIPNGEFPRHASVRLISSESVYRMMYRGKTNNAGVKYIWIQVERYVLGVFEKYMPTVHRNRIRTFIYSYSKLSRAARSTCQWQCRFRAHRLHRYPPLLPLLLDSYQVCSR